MPGKNKDDGNPFRMAGDDTPTDAFSINADEFFVNSTNSHDHSENLQVKVPRSLLMEAEKLAQDPEFPHLRTKHDVVRDALTHRMAYLRLESERFKSDSKFHAPMNRLIAAGRLETVRADNQQQVFEFEQCLNALDELVTTEMSPEGRKEILENVELTALCLSEPFASRLWGRLARYDIFPPDEAVEKFITEIQEGD